MPGRTQKNACREGSDTVSEMPSVEQLARYLAGELDPAERRAFEARVVQDEKRAFQLYGDNATRAVLERAAQARGEHAASTRPIVSHRRGNTSRRRFAGPLWWWVVAAVLVVGAAVVWKAGDVLHLRQRVTHPVRGEKVHVLAPGGVVDLRPSRFEWKPFRGADRYRFELADESARTMFAVVVRGTVASVDSSRVPPRGRWSVTPLAKNNVPLAPPVWTPYRTRGRAVR